MPKRIANVKILKAFYLPYAKPQVKELVNGMIDLYEEGKIMNINTVKNALDKLTSPIKRERDAAIQEYSKKKETYKSRQSVIGKLERETEQFKSQLVDCDIE